MNDTPLLHTTEEHTWTPEQNRAFLRAPEMQALLERWVEHPWGYDGGTGETYVDTARDILAFIKGETT